MKMPFVLFVLMELFGISCCLAQSAAPYQSNNWGKPIFNVQLSVGVSNNIIAVGSNVVLSAGITNGSTNLVYLGKYIVFLVDDSGTTYQLNPSSPGDFSKIWSDANQLHAGELRRFVIEVGLDKYYDPPGYLKVDKKVDPGAYTLKVVQTCSVDVLPPSPLNPFDVESNNVRIKIE